LKRAALLASRVTIWTGAILIALVIASAIPFDGARASDDDQHEPAVSSVAGGHVVQMSRPAQEKGGVITSLPKPVTFQKKLRVYGTVLSLDRLVALYNTALTDAAQLQLAETKATAARSANERAKNLLKVFSTAKAQAESAEAAFQIELGGVAFASAQAQATRNTAVQEWGAVLGPAITARAPLAEGLVSRKSALVLLSMPPGIDMVPPRHIALTAGSGTSSEGVFISEAPQSDPRMQSIGLLYLVTMSPNLSSGVSLVADLPKGDSTPGLEIPSSAVVWDAGKAWIYVRTAPETFERHPLDSAAAVADDGGYVVPAPSLPVGSALVVGGAQILLSQESRNLIPSDEDAN
jgi:hypothetical protein